MDKLIILNAENTTKMSSKEMALVTNKQHKTILRDIRKMFSALKKEGTNMCNDDYSAIKDNRGYYVEIFLNRNLTYTLVSGYSTLIRNKIINRWLELESQSECESECGCKIKQQPSTQHELLEIESKTNALITLGLEPQVAKIIGQKLIEHTQMEDRLSNIDDMNNRTITTYTATEMSKELGFRSAIEFNNFLHEIGVQYKLRGCWFLYSKYTKNNWIAYKDYKIEKSDGEVLNNKQMEWTEMAKEALHHFCKLYRVGKFSENLLLNRTLK